MRRWVPFVAEAVQIDFVSFFVFFLVKIFHDREDSVRELDGNSEGEVRMSESFYHRRKFIFEQNWWNEWFACAYECYEKQRDDYHRGVSRFSCIYFQRVPVSREENGDLNYNYTRRSGIKRASFACIAVATWFPAFWVIAVAYGWLYKRTIIRLSLVKYED